MLSIYPGAWRPKYPALSKGWPRSHVSSPPELIRENNRAQTHLTSWFNIIGYEGAALGVRERLCRHLGSDDRSQSGVRCRLEDLSTRQFLFVEAVRRGQLEQAGVSGTALVCPGRVGTSRCRIPQAFHIRMQPHEARIREVRWSIHGLFGEGSGGMFGRGKAGGGIVKGINGFAPIPALLCLEHCSVNG